jgi:CAAX prenyl protease-like protein
MTTDKSPRGASPDHFLSKPTFEFWLPIVLFGALTMAESYLPVKWFPIAYVVKAVVVTASLLAFRTPLADIHAHARLVLSSVLIGLVVCGLWLFLDRHVPYPHFGSRTAFDPTPLRGSVWWIPFLAVRLYGLVVMVPIMEEIFWRSFLLRYLTEPDFRRLPVGTFSASALGVMVAASALSHPEWLVAALASLVYAFWLRRTGSLFGAIVAHATTNAALGAYVLATGAWQYW